MSQILKCFDKAKTPQIIVLLTFNSNTHLCVPFGESINCFLILDLPDFAVERNVKSEIRFVTLVTFRKRVHYALQPLKKGRVFYCLTNYAIIRFTMEHKQMKKEARSI